eukprot:scaffold6433_cov125-Cylindrotheca_fusiformis.AAC.8
MKHNNTMRGPFQEHNSHPDFVTDSTDIFRPSAGRIRTTDCGIKWQKRPKWSARSNSVWSLPIANYEHLEHVVAALPPLGKDMRRVSQRCARRANGRDCGSSQRNS